MLFPKMIPEEAELFRRHHGNFAFGFFSLLVASIGFSQTTKLTNPLTLTSWCLDKPYHLQTKLMDSLGYSGLWYNDDNQNIPLILDSLKARNMQLTGIYFRGLGNKTTEIQNILKVIKGSSAKLSIGFPGSYISDESVLNHLKPVAELAKANGTDITIFLHAGYYIEAIEEAVRIIQKLNMDNVKIMYNLPHGLMVNEKRKTNFNQTEIPLLKEHIGLVSSISLVGADSSGAANLPKDGEFKKVLGEGNFNVLGFIEKLLEWGYKDEFAIKCWDENGEKKKILVDDMNLWREWQGKLLAPTTRLTYGYHSRINAWSLRKERIFFHQDAVIQIRSIHGKLLLNHSGIKGTTLSLKPSAMNGIVLPSN